MSNEELIAKLELNGFQVTPSALEILNSSKIPSNNLINEIKSFWRGKNRIITVEKAINLILVIKNSSKDLIASKEFYSHLEDKIEDEQEVPRVLRRTYFTLKRFDVPVTAGKIAIVTHRKKSTERIYLNRLFKHGLIKKIQKETQEAQYIL